MTTGYGRRETPIEVRAQSVLQVLIVALLIWFGTTVVSTRDAVIVLNVEVASLKNQVVINTALLARQSDAIAASATAAAAAAAASSAAASAAVAAQRNR